MWLYTWTNFSVMMTFALIVVTPILANDKTSSAAQTNSFNSNQFLKSYCIDCHTVDDPSGEREFESLVLTKSDLDTQLTLQEIIDQLTLGTMPPEDGEQPSTQNRLAAIKAFTNRLQEMRQQTASTGGKTVLRRLSKREYRRTVGDLLGIDMTMFDPTLEFPGDNLSGHFDNIGNALVTSGHLLERYLAAAEQSVEKALALTKEPEVKTWTFRGNFYQQAELKAGHERAFKNRFLCLYDHPYNDKPEGAYGHISDLSKGVPVDGVYEIRVHAKAMHRDTPYNNKTVRIDLDEPFRMGLRPGDTSLGDMVHTQPMQPKLAEVVIEDDEFRWYTFEVPLDRGFGPRFTFENGIHDVRGSFGRIYRVQRQTLPKQIQNEKGIFDQRIAIIKSGQMPHIRIDEVQIRGPIKYSWPTLSQQILVGDSEFQGDMAESLIAKFATRAFRRPATSAEIDGLVHFYHSRIQDGQNSWQAYKDTLKATLCAPGFLYFQQPDETDGKKLSPHAFAERLSYFLTSSMPDDRLRELADRGELFDNETLRGEVKRLLRSEASDAFVTDFLNSWLNLRDLGSMPPDPQKFWFYYASGLEAEMKKETELFLQDLISQNAPVTDFVSAQHSFVNRDLAKLYGIIDQASPETANDFRRVTFSDPRRGGLLGQASILTVSANGIETSPIIRGVWLLENILGTPTPPPPDDVPALEPDTRGATTIRDQLSKHRDHAACNQCHRKIDPLGFAFEAFDAIGQSRKHYDQRQKQIIDTSGILPGGQSFADAAELKQLLLKRKVFFVRTFTERLLTHALGRQLEPLDRSNVDNILKTVQEENYPTASLIEAIVLSDLFRK